MEDVGFVWRGSLFAIERKVMFMMKKDWDVPWVLMFSHVINEFLDIFSLLRLE